MKQVPEHNDHLQCGCKKVTKVKKSGNNTVRMERCECTIQNNDGFIKQNGKITSLKFGSMATGEDSSL